MAGPIYITVDLDARGLRDAFRRAPRKAARAVYRAIESSTTDIANNAKTKLTSIQNPKLHPEQGQRGGTAQSIHPTTPVKAGSVIFGEVKWGNAIVGPMLEWGPSKKTWPIRPKYFSALRFGWPNAPQGGFTATQVGMKGGKRVMALTENVFYFKRVKHIDRPSHRRVHMKPAVEKQEPIFIRDLLRIPKEIL